MTVNTPCSLETLRAISLKVVEASPDAKIVIDRRREIVIFNEEAEFLFGYARSDVIGSEIEMLMPEDIRQRHASHIASFFKSPRRREMGQGMELFAVNRDGEKFLVKIRLAPIVIDGEGGGVFGLAVVRRAEP